MKAAYFITGTDTGVGKTLISSALINGFVSHGYKTAGMKPVAAGCELQDSELISEDVTQLVLASNVTLPLRQINPYAFLPALAPHIAAEQAGVNISLKVITDAYRQASTQADVVIVEGVGGFCVPLGDDIDTADMAQRLGLPLIMVVGMRLGCLNHALLTAEAIKARGLKLAGWVANQIDPKMSAFEENLQALKERLGCPCLGVVPWSGEVNSVDVAKHLSEGIYS
ncbi:MAG TPA: dethiobiotin synthase [Methylophilaceae bacterium]|jgi:dethiobiotin synthetase